MDDEDLYCYNNFTDTNDYRFRTSWFFGFVYLERKRKYRDGSIKWIKVPGGNILDNVT